ncbi:MAG: hypothetical protein FWF81_12775 [Defluviitaleaceae bacterium]|nr:hypothetical protein [Defluviitaleaceae bacterium]
MFTTPRQNPPHNFSANNFRALSTNKNAVQNRKGDVRHFALPEMQKQIGSTANIFRCWCFIFLLYPALRGSQGRAIADDFFSVAATILTAATRRKPPAGPTRTLPALPEST